MPTWEEMKQKLAGMTDQQERNRLLAEAQTDQETYERFVQPLEPTELTGRQAEIRMTPQTHEGPELTAEEVRQRMGGAPEEQPTFEGIVQRMAQNYQTSPQYQQLLDQELAQISEQIAQLVQRRNMIEMAKRGQG